MYLGWGGEPGGGEKVGGALVVVHAGWGVVPGGGVLGGGHVLVLCWRGGGGWPAFESSVRGGSGVAVLWWC